MACIVPYFQMPEQIQTSQQPSGCFIEYLEVAESRFVSATLLPGLRYPDPGCLAQRALYDGPHGYSNNGDHGYDEGIQLQASNPMRRWDGTVIVRAEHKY